MGAAAVPIISGGLGILGLIQQHNANQEAQNNANSQLAMQQQLVNQQIQGYNNYQNQVGDLTMQGAFNPDIQIKQADAARNYQEGQALNNEASGAKILGYRPGDTAPLQAMNATRGNYNLLASQQDQQLVNQAHANQLAAWAPLLPNASGAAMNALGENYRTDLGMQQGSGGMLGSLMPYLGQIMKGAGSGAASSSAAMAYPMMTDPGTGSPIDSTGNWNFGNYTWMPSSTDTGTNTFLNILPNTAARPNNSAMPYKIGEQQPSVQKSMMPYKVTEPSLPVPLTQSQQLSTSGSQRNNPFA